MSDLLAELHKDAPPLTLHPTQAEYDAWVGYYQAHTREVLGDSSSLWFVDVNDAVMNFLTLCHVVQRHPELAERAETIVEPVVRYAMGPTGGMVGGAAFIARELDVDFEETQNIMMGLLSG